jgi:hypothetical protein
MPEDSGLRPLYLLLFAAGIGILVSLAMNARADVKPIDDTPRHIETKPTWELR